MILDHCVEGSKVRCYSPLRWLSRGSLLPYAVNWARSNRLSSKDPTSIFHLFELRSSSGESLSALERSVCRHLPVARTLQRGPNPTATSGGSELPREVFAGAPPEKGNKAPDAPAPSPAPEPEPEPAPDPLSIAPLNGTEGPYNEKKATSDRPLHDHLILPGHSDPSPAPDVGGGSVGSAATVLDGVSSPGQAVDAGQPLPSGGAATSSTTISRRRWRHGSGRRSRLFASPTNARRR
eukprot:COSAG06_NODE_8621_length_2113_cov_4.315789_2_plen_237_part_00